jgi:hypothetical protein
MGDSSRKIDLAALEWALRVVALADELGVAVAEITLTSDDYEQTQRIRHRANR